MTGDNEDDVPGVALGSQRRSWAVALVHSFFPQMRLRANQSSSDFLER